MKVPPKRKGNTDRGSRHNHLSLASMKVPPKRKGNFRVGLEVGQTVQASMKVPPKRKGNREFALSERLLVAGLNESLSKKEGK